jgi:sulfide:quinone oxidoreductase
MTDAIILGGGFGGLAAAHRLRQKGPDDLSITLVDRGERFHPGLAKLWDIAGLQPLSENSRPLAALEKHGIRYLKADILGIDPDERKVSTSEGDLQGDALLIALGAGFATQHTEMLQGRGHNLYSPTAVPSIREAIGGLDGGRIVIVIMGLPYKCPPAPFEAALLIEERLRKEGRRSRFEIAVHTPQPSPLPVAGPDASARVAEVLSERGIELHRERKIAGVEQGRVLFQDGEEEMFTLLLGVPRHVAPEALVGSGLLGESGWIEPDQVTMRTSSAHIYAAGDCTHIPTAGGALPKAGVFAEKQGLVAADNILAAMGVGESAGLDGNAFCFLEFGDRQAAYVEGDFLAQPKPAVRITDPDEETFRAKERFVREHLEAWLG